MRILTRDKSFYRSLTALAIPIVLQNLITFLVNFADNLMIGKLGDFAVSGVSIGNNFQTVLQMFTIGIDAAILILASQYWGIKDLKSVKKIGAMGTRYAVIVGIILSLAVILFPRQLLRVFTTDAGIIDNAASYVVIVAFSYAFFCASQMMVSTMRAVENTKLGLYCSFIALFVNVGLNWVLIFGKFGLPALGVRGAALATLIARIVEFVVVYYYAFRLDQQLKLRFRDLFVKEPLLRHDFVKSGLPVLLGQLVWAVNLLFYSAIMGHMNASAVTAANIVGQMESLLRVGVFGLCSALGIITGKTVGAGKFETMKEYARTAQVLFLVIGIFSGLLVYIFKAPFTSLYSSVSEEAVAYSMQFFRVLTITIVGTCWQATCLAGLVKSGGDTSFVFKNDSIFVFFVLIPAGFLTLHFGAPAWAVYFALKCDQLLKCIVAYFKINSFNWMKKLTREIPEEA